MSVNRVILIGFLGKDPETRYLQSGTQVCNFSIATTEKWTSNGEPQEHTEWHNIQAFGKLAEICGRYLKKGRQVYIEGRIHSREYTDKSGIQRRAFDIVANAVQFLGAKGDNVNADRAGYDPGPEPSRATPDDGDIPF